MITNIIGELGDFVARIAWHLVLFILNLLVSAIQGLAAFMFPMITAVFTTIMTTTGMSTLCQPITSQMAPYWNNVAVNGPQQDPNRSTPCNHRRITGDHSRVPIYLRHAHDATPRANLSTTANSRRRSQLHHTDTHNMAGRQPLGIHPNDVAQLHRRTR